MRKFLNTLRAYYSNAPRVSLALSISFAFYVLLISGCGTTFGDNKTNKLPAGLTAKRQLHYRNRGNPAGLSLFITVNGSRFCVAILFTMRR